MYGTEINKSGTEGICNESNRIAYYHSEENWDDFDHAFTPDVADNYYKHCNKGKGPACGSV